MAKDDDTDKKKRKKEKANEADLPVPVGRSLLDLYRYMYGRSTVDLEKSLGDELLSDTSACRLISTTGTGSRLPP